MQVESSTHANNGPSDVGDPEATDPIVEVHAARAVETTKFSGNEPSPGSSTHSLSEDTSTVKKPVDISKSWHEGLKYQSWDAWDLPTTVTDEELQAQRDAVGKRYGFCPQRGMHKNNEPSRIPIRYMYLFGSYPMDDPFSVTQCRHCSHICKSEYFSTHLEQDCVKRPLETESDEEYEPETNYDEEEEECEEGEGEDASPVSSGDSESETEQQVSSRSASSHSNRSRSRSASPSARSRSSSSGSRSGSPYEVEEGEEEEAHYHRSRSHSGSRSRSRSRSASGSDQEEEGSPRSYASRSRSASPTSSPEPEDECREGEDSDNEENQEEYESVEQEGEGFEEYEEGSPEEDVYNEGDYEILPHLNASPQDSDLDLKDLEQYPACQVLSPSNSAASIRSSHISVKGEPYDLGEEQIQFQLLGGLSGAGSCETEFEAVGTPVDPLELESASAEGQRRSMESPDRSPSSPAFSNAGTPSHPKSAKKKKKKLKDEPRKIIPLKDRRFNPDEHCGVINAEGVPCTRSLTCKSHSMALRRAVQERSQSFDILLASHKKARDEAKAAKIGTVDIADENDIVSSFNSHGQKPVEEATPTRISWTSPNSVKLALANMLRECALNGPRTPPGIPTNYKINATQVPGRKGGKGSKCVSVKTERFPQVVPEENALDERGSVEETVLDPALYGNQSHLLSNPLDDSDEEINESDWEWVPLIKIKDLSLEDVDVQPRQMQFNSTSSFPGASQVLYTDARRIAHQPTARETIEAHMGDIGLQSRSPKTGFGLSNPRKRPLSPSNNLVPLQHTPIKKSRTDVTTLEALLSPQSTLSSLATQLPNPTKSSLGSRTLPTETFPNPTTQKNFSETTEVSLKDFQSLQLVSSSDSPPISLASLLGIRPQGKQEMKLNPNSGVQPGMIIPNQTQVQRSVANITGRSQPRKQQFPTVKPGGSPVRPGQAATATVAKGQQSQPVTVKLPGKMGGSSPAICLVNPEQQFQQQTQFGQYELHLPEAFSSGNATVGSESVVGTSSVSAVPMSQITQNPQQFQTGTNQPTIRQHLQHLQLKQTMTAYVKQEPGSGSPLQQRGSSTPTTSQFSDYTLQIQEQGPASAGSGDSSWASLSQGTGQRRQEDDAPVADSELSKLLASQFEFED